MALIKIRLNLQKSQTSTKMIFAYLCSSSGSLLSFDELSATCVILGMLLMNFKMAGTSGIVAEMDPHA